MTRKILFYDIETTPLKAWIWRLGKQVIRHDQLDPNYSRYGVICITYGWNDGNPIKSLGWGYKAQDTKRIIATFDRLVQKADVVIGKNSDRFDNKHINTLRMWHDLPGCPEWIRNTDDLEAQLRRHFYLPSYSLDYISKELGLDGKIKMSMQDWIDIVERNGSKGLEAYNRMLEYGRKDTDDTRAIWNACEKYFMPKHNAAAAHSGFSCCTCGSKNIFKNGVRASGKSLYQQFFCRDHRGYAGRVILKDNQLKGKIGK